MLIFAECQAGTKTTKLATASKIQTNDRGDRQDRKRRGLILTLYNRSRLNGALIEQRRGKLSPLHSYHSYYIRAVEGRSTAVDVTHNQAEFTISSKAWTKEL
jgi:hypothetical protein